MERALATRPLPPYRALLAVDIVRFSRTRGVFLGDLREQVPVVLERAMNLSGLQDAWDARRFPDSAGDDYIFGTDPASLPFLIWPLLGNLQTVLEEVDHQLAARDRDLRLRLRAALHVGPVPDSGDPVRDRISEPTVTTFRLLSSEPINEALKRSHPDVTQTAAVLSQRVYDDVIRPGYTPMHPSEFTPVTAEVPGKDFAEPAWLYVPRPSWQAEPPDRPVDSPAPTTEEKAGGPRVVFNAPVGQSNTAQQMQVNQTLPPDFFSSAPGGNQGE